MKTTMAKMQVPNTTNSCKRESSCPSFRNFTLKYKGKGECQGVVSCSAQKVIWWLTVQTHCEAMQSCMHGWVDVSYNR